MFFQICSEYQVLRGSFAAAGLASLAVMAFFKLVRGAWRGGQRARTPSGPRAALPRKAAVLSLFCGSPMGRCRDGSAYPYRAGAPSNMVRTYCDMLLTQRDRASGS